MTGFGPPPVQHAPGRGKPGVPLWVLVLAFALMVGLAGALALVVTREAAAKALPTYPKQWDSRVAPYATIAEKQRGLLFLHPVKVRFLPPAAFEKTVTADDTSLDKEARAELDQFTGLMRALGLVTGKVDLFGAVNDVSGAGTLAYYSFEDKRITIRGNAVTPAVRSTLVHELTHVLQDQHFDIGDRLTRLRKAEAKGTSTTAASVFDGLIEGDASRVQTRYRASLSARQQKALDAGRKSDSTQVSKRLTHVPEVIITMMTSPYTLGEALVQTVADREGNFAVDELFRHPPKHEDALLDPSRVLAHRRRATEVAAPTLPRGTKSFESGELGAVTWYLMLAERIPLKDALAAVDGWAGDSHVAFRRGGRSCVDLRYAGRSAGDTTRMLSALQVWASASPGSGAKVRREGRLLRVESCDPGPAGRAGRHASAEAVGLVVTRAMLATQASKLGVPAAAARCIAGRIIREVPLSRMNDVAYFATPEVRRQMMRIGVSCR
jgi:hypothetical protein